MTETEVSTHRGRPRPQETLERDEQVYQLLTRGPLTKSDIAEKLGIEQKQVYLSLFRLRRDNHVRRSAGGTEDSKSHTWEVVPQEG